jgi:hypothetical protein
VETGVTYLSATIPRLRIGSGWTEITIQSEVGVVKTARGYAPAVCVLRGDVEHVLLVGAASLSGPLEEIRNERQGSLAGAHIRVRKIRPEQSAPYEVEQI